MCFEYPSTNYSWKKKGCTIEFTKLTTTNDINLCFEHHLAQFCDNISELLNDDNTLDIVVIRCSVHSTETNLSTIATNPPSWETGHVITQCLMGDQYNRKVITSRCSGHFYLSTFHRNGNSHSQKVEMVLKKCYSVMHDNLINKRKLSEYTKICAQNARQMKEYDRQAMGGAGHSRSAGEKMLQVVHEVTMERHAKRLQTPLPSTGHPPHAGLARDGSTLSGNGYDALNVRTLYPDGIYRANDMAVDFIEENPNDENSFANGSSIATKMLDTMYTLNIDSKHAKNYFIGQDYDEACHIKKLGEKTNHILGNRSSYNAISIDWNHNINSNQKFLAKQWSPMTANHANMKRIESKFKDKRSQLGKDITRMQSKPTKLKGLFEVCTIFIHNNICFMFHNIYCLIRCLCVLIFCD